MPFAAHRSSHQHRCFDIALFELNCQRARIISLLVCDIRQIHAVARRSGDRPFYLFFPSFFFFSFFFRPSMNMNCATIARFLPRFLRFISMLVITQTEDTLARAGARAREWNARVYIPRSLPRRSTVSGAPTEQSRFSAEYITCRTYGRSPFCLFLPAARCINI